VKRFQKLSSIVILLVAFIYPPSIATAKVVALNEQSVGTETNLVGDSSEELLLAHRYNVRRNRHKQRNCVRRNRYERRNCIRRNRYRRVHNVRQNRYGRWQLAPNRDGRMMFELQRY
jgi:hypothetical protein